MDTDTPLASSRFSDFIRNATPDEKARVYLAVMERACMRQRELIQQAVHSPDRSAQPPGGEDELR